MGVSVCGGSATWRNFEDHGSAEYKLRLFRASLCYLGCSFHSLCPTHHIRSIRGFALLKRPPLVTRKFLFIDIQQVAILSGYISYSGNQQAISDGFGCLRLLG